MNYRKELNYLIESYVDEYYGGDRNKVAHLFILIYQKLGRIYKINFNKECKKDGISKIEYLERKGLLKEAYDYAKKLVYNGKTYWDKKREEEEKKKKSVLEVEES